VVAHPLDRALSDEAAPEQGRQDESERREL
jgi:hypothetical protein